MINAIVRSRKGRIGLLLPRMFIGEAVMATVRDQAARALRPGPSEPDNDAAGEASRGLAESLRAHVAEETKRRPAEPRQDHLADHRLHEEQQKGADEQRDGKERQGQGPPPDIRTRNDIARASFYEKEARTAHASPRGAEERGMWGTLPACPRDRARWKRAPQSVSLTTAWR